jgi:hypothetical protein
MRLATSLVILAIVWLPGCRSSRPEPSPGEVQVLLQRGVGSADSGDDRAAIADYDEVLRLQPENAEAAYLRGAAPTGNVDRRGGRLRHRVRLNPMLRLRRAWSLTPRSGTARRWRRTATRAGSWATIGIGGRACKESD